VAVIGVKLEDQESELPRAYVVRKESVDSVSLVTEEELKLFLMSRLAKYKALDGGVRFVKAIPKTQTGKTLKRILRENAEKELSGA